MKATIYIATNDSQFAKLINSAFEGNSDFEINYLDKSNYSVLETVNPSILLVDLQNLTVINKLLEKINRTKTKIIIVNGDKPYYSKSIKYYLNKPVSELELKQIFYNCLNNKEIQVKRLDTRLATIFISIGIPSNTKGFWMLIPAVKVAAKHPEYFQMITKKLYPEIAKLCDSTPSIVERDIRHALNLAHQKGSLQNLNRIFGAKLVSPNKKPTNSEFISIIAEQMMLEGYFEDII